jgi:hypothetical protein
MRPGPGSGLSRDGPDTGFSRTLDEVGPFSWSDQSRFSLENEGILSSRNPEHGGGQMIEV